MQLNQKQKLFVEHYLKTGNGAASAVAAGYSTKGSNVRATSLLSNINVKAYLEEKKAELAIQQAELAKKTQITTEWLVENAKKVLEYSLQLRGKGKDKVMVSPKYAIAANEQIAKLTGLLSQQQDTNITVQIERKEKELEVLEDFSAYQDQIITSDITSNTIQPNLQLVKAPSTAVDG